MAASISLLFALFFVGCPSVCPHGHEKKEDVFDIVGKPDPQSTVKLVFAIKQKNKDFLRKKLLEVSHPKSSFYGHYMNFDEISKHVYGVPESVKAVEETLVSLGVTPESRHFTIGRDFAVVPVPVFSVSELFTADFYFYKGKKSGEVHVKSANYSIPEGLKDHIDFVFGISELPRPSKVFARPHVRSLQDGGDVTPDLLYKDYNIGNYTSTNANNSQAIASFLKEYFSPSDLSAFEQNYNLPNKSVSKIVGTNDVNNPGIEANLDVQFIMTTGRNVDTWFVSTSELANHNQEGFLTWIIGQVNRTDSPLVHSVSYGDFEDTIPLDFKNRMEVEFQKFGVSGRTVFFASGDEGVDCKGVFKRHFNPMWPASSPFVTTVGGAVSLSEAWKEGGGGFSNTFPRPSYQDAAVTKYLNSGVAPSTSYFNVSGRAYPDISAYSVSCLIVILGLPWPVDGTSCATPIYAGIASLLNDVRLSQGKPTLGFLNPLLYQQLEGNGFYDITKGENSGGLSLCGGFKATEGWDPASGWGSPDFSRLKSLI